MLRTIPDWREQLQNAVSPLSDGVGNLHVNDFRPSDELQLRPGRTAAVLVPILDLEQPEILLTKRAAHMSKHAGQISFPGGAAEKADDSAVTTALREAWEEVGLPPESVTPLGFLDRFDTISDYRVLPVVGWVDPPSVWNIDHREVDEVFTLPLEVALDLSNYSAQKIERNNQEFLIHSIEWKGHVIWGLTAAMLLNLQYRMNGLNTP